MRTLTLLPFLMIACDAGSDDLTADQELLLSATQGEEERVAGTATTTSLGMQDAPDQPPLMRACDAEGTYVGLFSDYDDDADGDLGPPEQDAVFEARGDRDDLGRRHAHAFMHLLGLVYDTDADGELSESERAVLFDDFTLRCEALHEALVDRFDTDGDGELSDDELAGADATLRAEHEAHRAELEEQRDGMEPGGPGDGPPDRDAVPPPLSEFDTDGDGVWSEAELDAMRTELRARIQGGEPLCGGHDNTEG